MMKRKTEGFTLIELLVVIAIIGVLSSVVLASLNTARKKARDARRLSDMKQIEMALQLFYDDKGYFPRESAGVNGKIGEGIGLDSDLAPYMPTVPHDPLATGNNIYYYYYDGNHCNSTGSYNIVTISFNKAETDSDIRNDTTCGGEGNVPNSDYVINVGKSSG